MTAFAKFDRAEQLERLAAEIYALLSRRMTHDARMSALFQRLAEEEAQHALRVRMLKDRYLRNPKAFGEIALDEAEVRSLVEDGRALLTRFALPGPLDLGEATHAMAVLEERLAGVHAQAMARAGAGELADFFEALAQQDRAHREQLLG